MPVPETTQPSLASLPTLSYVDDTGHIPTEHEGKVGVYAIFDQTETLQYVGYSRDIYLSLKQHLVRQPQACYGYKAQTIGRPSRTVLAEISEAWLAENGSVPPGNGADEDAWTQPMNAKLTMTAEEQAEYQALEEIAQIKFLKKIARRLESQIKETLTARGVQTDFRFNPKLKEKGLLDLK